MGSLAPMSFCPNISDYHSLCFTLSVSQSSQVTPSVDALAPYPILGTLCMCRENKDEFEWLKTYDLATFRQPIYQRHFLGFCLKPPTQHFETKPVIFDWS